MKKLIIAIILLLGILFIISRFTELQEVVSVVKKGNLLWMLAAFTLLSIWMLVTGATFQSLFKLLDIQKPLLQVTRLVLAVNFINLAAPSAGVGGMAVFFNDARRNGHSTARVMVGSALFLIFDYLGLLTIIFFGLIILSSYKILLGIEILAYALFILFVLALASLLILASRSERILTRILLEVANIVNRLARPIKHGNLIDDDRVIHFCAELFTGVQALRGVRYGWVRPVFLTVSNKLLLIGILGLIFLAFNTPVTPGVLVAGFSIAYLFAIISPTPAGIGFVEGLLTLALSSLSIPIEAAAVITLAFRGYTFWLPFVIGMIAFRSLHT